MPNENCLSGMRCPKCGSYGPYRIEVVCTMEVSDDGTDSYEGADWGVDSACACMECDRTGKVRDFRKQNQEEIDAHIANDEFQCHQCNEWVDIEDSVENNGEYFCASCAERIK